MNRSAQEMSVRKMAAGRVAIVIATHRYCFPLERCIESHCRMLESPADLIFVDNGSGNEMTTWARDHFPDITVVTRDVNGFFCGGYNSGMQYAIDHDYEHVLIVNADTEVHDEHYLSALVEAADQKVDAAFIGPKVFLREAGNVQNTILRFPWFRRHLAHWLTSRVHPVNRSEEAKQIAPVDFLNGVCVLCRVSALREVGLLDEDMGGYVEDTDWSWRAGRHGWKSYYLPVSSIIHHQATDEYEHHSVKSFMLRRNHVYWHMKVGHRWQAWLFAGFSLLLAEARMLKARLARRNVSEHQRYVRRFRSVARRILAKEPMGDWFGPPFGNL
ncbi:MAG: glycosyltransferase family 2 protein [Planctomycetaceae bacterium]|nr:glycosyltransferase family 2 protein [Planctomycetaceae bacterium]